MGMQALQWWQAMESGASRRAFVSRWRRHPSPASPATNEADTMLTTAPPLRRCIEGDSNHGLLVFFIFSMPFTLLSQDILELHGERPEAALKAGIMLSQP